MPPSGKRPLDFKDASAQRFGRSNVFLFLFSNEHQKVPPVNYQQKSLINGIGGTFDIKSNYFGPVIPKKLKVLKNWIRGPLNLKNVFL